MYNNVGLNVKSGGEDVQAIEVVPGTIYNNRDVQLP
jgi:hypothetical protein